MSEVNLDIQQNLQAMVMNFSQYTPADSVELNERGGWIAYGQKNTYPDYLITQYLSSPIHGTLCRGISAMIAGGGISGIPMAAKEYRAMCLDLKLHGGFYCEVRPNLAGTGIADFRHLPFENCRLARPDDFGNISGVYFSRDWSQPRKFKPVFIPLAPQKEFGAWEQEEKTRTSVVWGFMPTPGTISYPKPDYQPGMNYIELANQISEYHINNILNGLFPSFMVSMIDGAADDIKRRKLREDLEGAKGAKNAGRFMVMWTDSKDNVPQITPFPLSDADKQYQFLADESMKQILFAHRVTSPLLFGIRDTGGGLGSNTDEMKQSWRLFEMNVLEPFREIIQDTFLPLGYTVDILPGASMFDQEQAQIGDGTATATTDSADVASTALNGAQIASLIDIVVQATTDVIPIPSAKAIVKAGFPMLSDAQVEAIFKDVVPGSVESTEVVQSKVAGNVHIALKLKSAVEMSADDENTWLTFLEKTGEQVSLDEWEVVSEEFCDTLDEPEDFRKKFSAEQKSKWGDAGLYKLRYRYSTSITAESRSFCKRMVDLSVAGILYRKEDIDIMSDSGVNSQFAPSGSTSYDIFQWKGGVYCHHKWVRVIFARKRDANGKILPASKTPDMENDKRVGSNPYVPKKGDEGVAPINTPSRGSLKYG